MRISDFTRREIEMFHRECNFTDTERAMFDLKAKDRTNVQIAMELSVSESTVSITMRRVRTKIMKVLDWGVQ